MKWLVLLILLSGCFEVVEHGSSITLGLNLLDCDRMTVSAGATQLRFTARSGQAVLLSRVSAIDEPPRTLALAQNTDVVLQVEALNAEGGVIARGSSLHFAVPSTEAIAVDLRRVGQFSRSCNSLVTARAFHSATVLGDGRVLVVGGEGNEALSSMELITGSDVRDIGPLAIASGRRMIRLPLSRHTATLIDFGQIVISGGEVEQRPLGITLVLDSTADFKTGVVPPGQVAPRSRGAAFNFRQKIFFVGGNTTGAMPLAAVDSLELSTFMFETSSSLLEPRLEAAMGRIDQVAIVAGGQGSAKIDLVSLEAPEIFRSLLLAAPRRGGSLATVGNRALIAGGFGLQGEALTSTEWITANPASVEPGPSISARGELCAVPLSRGQVLLLGGSPGAELLKADGTVEALPFAGSARIGQTCSLTEDGSVLIVGGRDDASRPVNEVWRYTPE